MDMSTRSVSRVAEVFIQHQKDILADWVREQMGAFSERGRIREPELRQQSEEFLHLLIAALGAGDADLFSSAWTPVREQLGGISRSRGQQGFSPAETASFIFSLKRPLFRKLQAGQAGDGPALLEDIWSVTELLDRLGILTMEAYQKTREEVILRQQEEMMELSTPVVKLWKGILALPLIGTLDSARTQVVMETLLKEIVRTGSGIAIIDITGVPTVDTLVAQHLIKTVTAARLMGAECIISGIRPQIAQTIVHLGVNLKDVITKSSLADAFTVALERTGLSIAPAAPSGRGIQG